MLKSQWNKCKDREWNYLMDFTKNNLFFLFIPTIKIPSVRRRIYSVLNRWCLQNRVLGRACASVIKQLEMEIKGSSTCLSMLKQPVSIGRLCWTPSGELFCLDSCNGWYWSVKYQSWLKGSQRISVTVWELI